MGRLAIDLLLSLGVLFVSFICVYYALPKRTKFARFSVTVLFIACGMPLALVSLYHSKETIIGANIGLGLAFMLTWVITAIVFLLSLILWVIRITKGRR